MTATVEQVIEMIDSKTITIDKTEYNVNKTNLGKYALNKEAQRKQVLERYQKSKGIVVKTKENTKK